MTEIRFLGQSCFELSDGTARVLVDPFLAPHNPAATVSADDLDADPRPRHPRARGPPRRRRGRRASGPARRLVAIVELAGWLGEQGVENTIDPNLGGTVEFDWGWVKLVQAFHTNTAPGTALQPRPARDRQAAGS